MKERKELKKCDFIKCDGVTVFEYDISLPTLTVGTTCDKRVNRLLERAYRNALARAEALGVRAQEEYKNDEGEKKRFYFRPYRYTFECKVSDEGGELLSLSFDGRTERRGRILSQERREIKVRRRDGLFVLPKKAKKPSQM